MTRFRNDITTAKGTKGLLIYEDSFCTALSQFTARERETLARHTFLYVSEKLSWSGDIYLGFVLHDYITARFLAISSSPRARWAISRNVLKRPANKWCSDYKFTNCFGVAWEETLANGNLFTARKTKQTILRNISTEMRRYLLHTLDEKKVFLYIYLHPLNLFRRSVVIDVTGNLWASATLVGFK